MDNFQSAQQTIKDASLAAAEAAKQNVVAAYEQATRMKINIKIKAPIVIVPVDSNSLEGIAIDLGNLNIENRITNIEVADNDYSPAVIDAMKLELSNVKLSKVHITQQSEDMQEELTSDSRFGTDGELLIHI